MTGDDGCWLVPKKQSLVQVMEVEARHVHISVYLRALVFDTRTSHVWTKPGVSSMVPREAEHHSKISRQQLSKEGGACNI